MAARRLVFLVVVVVSGFRDVKSARAHVAVAALPNTRSAAKAVLDQQGNGIGNTRKFRVPSEWRITYGFWGCQIPGFDVYVKGGPDDVMSTGGTTGHGVQYEHSGGTVYLTVNSACSWHVTVFPGGQTVNGPGLKISGNGIANAVRFRAPGEWRINYAFSHCQISGFDLYAHGDVDDIMSKSGKSGHGTQFEHSGGTVYLTINSACLWSVAISR